MSSSLFPRDISFFDDVRYITQDWTSTMTQLDSDLGTGRHLGPSLTSFDYHFLISDVLDVEGLDHLTMSLVLTILDNAL